MATWNIHQNKITCGQLDYLTKQSHVRGHQEYLSKQNHVWPPGIFIKRKAREATWNIYQNKVMRGHQEYLSK